MAAIGLLLNWLHIAGGALLFAVAAALLAVLYAVFSFALLNGIQLRRLFSKSAYIGITAGHILAAVGIGLLLALLCIGIAIFCLSWVGGFSIMAFGAICGLASLILLLYNRHRSRQPFYNRALSRLVPAFSLAVVLIIIAAL